MNILPKKRWHVRTKENIARVRKDEAEAAEKEREENLRIENADREARLNLLKNKSKARLLELNIDDGAEEQKQETATPLEHVNLFADLDHATTTTNKEHDKEVKEKKEEYEKKIGYLTYLGQDTNEAQRKKNWYEVLPQSSRFTRSEEIKDTYDKLVLKDQDGKPRKKDFDEKDGEIDYKLKQQHDPINKFREYCEGIQRPVQTEIKSKSYSIITSKEKMKESAKRLKHKRREDKDNKLQQLREARLKREQQEKYKTEMFLTELSGGTSTSTKEEPNKIMPKYHSQFNPEFARQNYR